MVFTAIFILSHGPLTFKINKYINKYINTNKIKSKQARIRAVGDSPLRSKTIRRKASCLLMSFSYWLSLQTDFQSRTSVCRRNSICVAFLKHRARLHLCKFYSVGDFLPLLRFVIFVDVPLTLIQTYSQSHECCSMPWRVLRAWSSLT